MKLQLKAVELMLQGAIFGTRPKQRREKGISPSPLRNLPAEGKVAVVQAKGSDVRLAEGVLQTGILAGWQADRQAPSWPVGKQACKLGEQAGCQAGKLARR